MAHRPHEVSPLEVSPLVIIKKEFCAWLVLYLISVGFPEWCETLEHDLLMAMIVCLAFYKMLKILKFAVLDIISWLRDIILGIISMLRDIILGIISMLRVIRKAWKALLSGK